MFLRVSTGIPILIYRLSTVYVPCINRISTVVNSGCKAWFSRRRKGAYWIPREAKGERQGGFVSSLHKFVLFKKSSTFAKQRFYKRISTETSIQL